MSAAENIEAINDKKDVKPDNKDTSAITTTKNGIPHAQFNTVQTIQTNTDNISSKEITTIKNGIPHALLTKTIFVGSLKSKREPDIMDAAAMENAYNICHNVQDLLQFRGFFWEGQKQKGQKKGRKKGKKGKG